MAAMPKVSSQVGGEPGPGAGGGAAHVASSEGVALP